MVRRKAVSSATRLCGASGTRYASCHPQAQNRDFSSSCLSLTRPVRSSRLAAVPHFRAGARGFGIFRWPRHVSLSRRALRARHLLGPGRMISSMFISLLGLTSSRFGMRVPRHRMLGKIRSILPYTSWVACHSPPCTPKRYGSVTRPQAVCICALGRERRFAQAGPCPAPFYLTSLHFFNSIGRSCRRRFSDTMVPSHPPRFVSIERAQWACVYRVIVSLVDTML
jgi:hypothetical protein